jgi:hypothetical protein
MTRLVDVEAGLRALTLGEGDDVLLPWPDAPHERQQLVRGMVRRNLSGIIERACPHARRIVGVAAFDVVIHRFLSSGPIPTRLTREIPAAFASWLERQSLSPLPPGPSDDAHDTAGVCFAELCHFEALEIAITLAETTTSRPGEPVDDALVELDGSARLAVYRHPVHEVSATTTVLPAEAAAPVVLVCVQRHEAMWVEVIEPALGKLLVSVAAGASVGEALDRVGAEDHRVVIDRERLRQRLVDLHRLGVIAGFGPPPGER